MRMRLFLRILSTLGVLQMLVGAAVPASAAGFGIRQVGHPLNMCIRRAQPGDDPARLIRQPERFDCRTEQMQFGPGDYWAISNPIDLRAPSAEPLTARISSLWQRSLTLHALYDDGHIAVLHDDSGTISRRIQLGAIVQYPLPQSKARLQRLMWKVEGAANMRGIIRNPRLASQTQAQNSNLMMGTLYAGFGGLAFALLIYNFALWASLRHRFQLAYCVMVTALMAYAFTSSGAIAWAFPAIENNDRLRLNYLFPAFACASALLFARTFFEDHMFGPRLRLAIRTTVVLLASVGSLFVVMAPTGVHFVDPIFSWIFVGVLGTVSATLWQAWRVRSNYLWLFALAWALPIFAASLRIFSNLGLIPWSFWIDNSTILSMAVEALISSVAIAYRIGLLSRERDEAVAAETVARRLADTDPLTGLLNRRAFLAAAIGREGSQTLLLLDLDHFKQVNDTLGHDGGDEVLRVVARTLRTAATAAPLDPDLLLARLRATRMPFDLRVTASVGSASGLLTTEPEWKTLYRSADTALFAAKSAGRDRARAAPLAA